MRRTKGKVVIPKPHCFLGGSSSSDEEMPRGKGKLLARFVSRAEERGRKQTLQESDVSSDEGVLERRNRLAHRPPARKHKPTVESTSSSSSSDSEYHFLCSAKDVRSNRHAPRGKHSFSRSSDLARRQDMRSKRKENEKLLKRVRSQKTCGRGGSPFDRALSLDNWCRRRVQYGCQRNGPEKLRASSPNPRQGTSQLQQQHQQQVRWACCGHAGTKIEDREPSKKHPCIDQLNAGLTQDRSRGTCSRVAGPNIREHRSRSR